MRIPTLLQKISELAEQPDRRGTIDVDLMLDYTRVLYADLLEWRSKLAATGRQIPPAPGVNTDTARPVAAPVTEPTPQSIPKPTSAPVPNLVTSTPSKPATNPVTPPIPPTATKPASDAVVNPVIPPVTPVVPPASMPPIHEPTLAELAAAMDKSIEEEEDEDESRPMSAQPKTPSPPRPATNTKPDIPVPATKTKTTNPDPEPQQPTAKPQTPKSDAAAGPKDIRAFISINEKYQIMSELFGNDKAAYEDALNHINTAENEAAALKWLQDRLWVTEERSDAALYFFDMLKRFKNHTEQGFLGFRD